MLGESVFSHYADTYFERQTRFGPMRVEVHRLPTLTDGHIVWSGMRWLHIGTRPLTLMEEVGREARLLVREGLKDVLEWLGERWYNEPSGDEIFQALKTGQVSFLDDIKEVSAR